MRARIQELLTNDPGQTNGSIASNLGVASNLAQVIIGPLLPTMDTRGARRGMKYYLPDRAPPEESDDEEILT